MTFLLQGSNPKDAASVEKSNRYNKAGLENRNPLFLSHVRQWQWGRMGSRIYDVGLLVTKLKN